jgi:glycosidase
MDRLPRYEFHVSRAARERYRFEEELFSWNGNVLFANVAASRHFAEKMNRQRDVERHPERTVHPGALNAMALIDELLHALVARYREQRDPKVMIDALSWFEQRVGREALDKTLLEFTQQFPPRDVYTGERNAAEWLKASSEGTPHRAVALEEMMMLWLANLNAAFRRFNELFDDDELEKATAYPSITTALKDYFQTRPRFGPQNQNLVDLLLAPALAAPDSLEGQLAYMRDTWHEVLGEMIRRILVAIDVFKEEEVAVWMRFHPQDGRKPHFGQQQDRGDSSAAAVPHYNLKEPEYERFSPDVDWMPRTVMIAKSTFVWLDQLSKSYKREIRRLDQVPDQELDTLARRGFNALWLIGVWERSKASQRVKQLTGNPEAAASAYSLFDYTIAEELGGEGSYLNLRDRAMARGIRMGSDMVPNHTGIDSRWVTEHPDWFISLPYPPFPAYRFDGPDLSTDERVEIRIEDHYYNKTDAAVVFRRRDRWSGDTRFIYHGNDGTSYPWNDTAQLNYLNPEVREAVIQKILYVARLSPVIRFDAAMTLAKQHYQRLWYPAPGTGGAIPSRAEHGLTKPEFDAAIPNEFWREVVDRCAAEAPGTLLLAEAFWLLEGYFVRTLGMHRVYNSAFMNMLRDEENANYRNVIKNTIEFDPEILKRYVNFMNNPDERTAVDQFGKGDKYFGVCTLMATLPGLPMFGHGQVEGFSERYGMEYRRAYHDESPDAWLIARHERQVAPLLHRRGLFAEVRNFLLYDFYTDSGSVNENVFAYSNSQGNERALVIFNNSYGGAHGWIRISSGFAEKFPDGSRSVRQRTLADAFALSGDDTQFVAARDTVTGDEHLYSGRELAEKGMRVELNGYQCHVYLDWKHFRDDADHPWRELYEQLRGRGVPSLSDAMRDLQLKPVHDALRAVLEPSMIELFAGVAPTEAGTSKKAEAQTRLNAPTVPAKKSAKTKTETVLTVPSDGQNRSGSQAKAADNDERYGVLASRVKTFIESARRLSSGESADALGLPPSKEWRGDVQSAIESFREKVRAASRIPALETFFSKRWSSQACGVLPSGSGNGNQPQWAAIITWATIHALGETLDPSAAGQAGTKLFDALRLREAMADEFSRVGLEGEDRWRAAARVRAVFANEAWLPGAKRSARSPYSWLHDPDVAWLINVHDYDGVRYFNKEMYECLLWWMALPALVRIAESRTTEPNAARELERQIQSRIDAAEAAGYQIMSLFELGEGAARDESVKPNTASESLLRKLQEDAEEPVQKKTR